MGRLTVQNMEVRIVKIRSNRMNAKKRSAITILLLCLCLLLSGCSRDIRAIYGGGEVPDGVEIASQSTEGEEAVSAMAGVQPDGLEGDSEQSSSHEQGAPSVGVAKISSAISDTNDADISYIDIYYDSTMSMMGFVDIPNALTSPYLQAVDLARQKGQFINAQVRMFRVDTDTKDLLTKQMDNQAVIAQIGTRSFYLSQPLLQLPEQIVPKGEFNPTSGTRLNRFVQSYYNVNNLEEPASAQLTAPAAWAMEHISDDHLSIIISDFSELLMGRSSLSDLVGQAYQRGLTVALVAVESDFAGIVPMKGNNTVWLQWGSMPSGTVSESYTYRYDGQDDDIHYIIPVSESEGERQVAKRPFYLLFIGRTSNMEQHVYNFTQRLSGENKELRYDYQIFEIDYRNSEYVLEEHVEPIAQQNEANVNYRLRAQADLPEILMEMGIPQDGSGAQRSALFRIDNMPKGTNPDIGSFTNETYSAYLTVTALGSDGEEETAIDLPKSMTASIVDADPNGEGFSLAIHHPVGALSRGNYRITVELYQRQPDVSQNTGHFNDFVASSPSGEFYATYDGSKTFGLAGLLDTIRQSQQIGISEFPLGSFQYDIIINEN